MFVQNISEQFVSVGEALGTSTLTYTYNTMLFRVEHSALEKWVWLKLQHSITKKRINTCKNFEKFFEKFGK